MSDGIQNIQETLRNIVTEYGEEILLDKTKLSDVLSEAAPAYPKAGTMLVQALDKGIGEYYTNTKNMPKERIISRTLDLLKPSFPDAEIQEITSVLFHAMGWDATIVRVYFAEYLKRIAPSKQVQNPSPPVENPAAVSSETMNMKNREMSIQNSSERSEDIPINQRMQNRKKGKNILLVVIALIMVGILSAVLLVWIHSRKPAQEVGMLQFDMNQDGTVDSTDAAAILGISAKMAVNGEAELDESLIKQGDVNGDSLVDASDAAQILQYAAQEGVADAK